MTSKLALAHSLAIGTAYMPLLHMRGERVFGWKLYLFTLYPYVLILQTGLGLCVIAVSALVGVFVGSMEDNRSFLARAFALLFGRVDEKYNNEHGSDCLPVDASSSSPSSSSPTDGRGGGGRWFDKAMKAFGFVLLSAQSTSTIFTVSRRKALDADSLSDARLLHLAWGALVSSALCMIYIIWEPRVNYTRSVVRGAGIHHRCYGLAETALEYIREMDIDNGRTHGRDRFRGFSNVVMIVLSPDRTIERVGTEYVFVSASLIMAAFYLVSLIVPKLWSRTERLTLEDLSIALVAGFRVSLSFYVGLKGRQPLFDMRNELIKLSSWPESEACPLLWEDPAADALWGLV